MMRDYLYYNRVGDGSSKMMDWSNPTLAFSFLFHILFQVLILIILVLIALWLWEKVKKEKKK